jgi:hypothetical protein
MISILHPEFPNSFITAPISPSKAAAMVVDFVVRLLPPL